MAFVKLDCGILRSTTWLDKDARDVFLTALLMAEPREYADEIPQVAAASCDLTGWSAPAGWYGYVPASGPGIIDAAKVEPEKGNAALKRLGDPEPASRSQDFEGRRMIRISGGYLILNFVRYRERDHTAADRSRRWRDRKKNGNVSGVTQRRSDTSRHVAVTEAEAEAEAEAEKGADLTRARGEWSARDWLDRFGAAWAKSKGKLTYGGGTPDAVATRELGEMLAALAPADRRECQDGAAAMFARYFANPRAPGHPFKWFVERFNELRTEAPPPVAEKLVETFDQKDARARREHGERRAADLAEIKRKSREAEQAAAEKLRQRARGVS